MGALLFLDPGSEPGQGRRLETGPLVTRHLAKARMTALPVGGGGANGLLVDAHEVPPDLQRSGQGLAADEQQPGARAQGQHHFPVAGGQVEQLLRGQGLPCDDGLPHERKEAVLEGGIQGEGDFASLGGVQIQPQNGGEVQSGGAPAAVLADEQSEGDLPLLPAGERRVVIEAGRGMLIRLGQGYPELGGVQIGLVRDRLLGVGDAPSCGHQVHLARTDHLLAAQAVPVEDLPLQHPGEGLQGDVGVGPHIHAGGAGGKAGRADMIEKTPGPDGAPLLDRDGASHRDAAHIGEAGGNALPLLCHGVLLVEEKVGARGRRSQRLPGVGHAVSPGAGE